MLENVTSVDYKRSRIEALKQRREELEQQMRVQRESVHNARAQVMEDCKTVAQVELEMQKVREQSTRADALNMKLGTDLEQIKTRVSHLRRRMVHQLLQIYPIETRPLSMPRPNSISNNNNNSISISSNNNNNNDVGDDCEWLVCGLHLPHSHFVGCEQEEIATALGYVCHMVAVVAQWFNVPLRYEMVPASSRSTISDTISPQASGTPQFPLYARGVDRTRFEYGVFLLNKNIEQLLNHAGMEVGRLQNTLPNLWRLLHWSEEVTTKAPEQQPHKKC